MWKGIYAHTSTGLNVLGSIIQGANFGIYLNSGVRFQCINNDFVNNYIGIAVGDPFLDDQFDRVIYQRAPIRGCEFYTSSNLPSPYPGHYYYPSWPITPTGVPFNKGFAAIFISGAAGLNVGYISATSTNRNKIYQMRNGIILRNAVSDISGTDFYDFEGQVPKNQANLILDHLQDHVNLEMNQVAIHASRADLNVKTCTFEDLKIGYYSFNSSQQLQNNTMDISDLSGSLSLTRGIHVVQPQTCYIGSNSITNGFKGIVLEDVHTSMTIEKNYLYRYLTSPRTVGIDINSLRYVDDEEGIIFDNTMYIYNASYSVGLNLTLVDHIDASENYIGFLGTNEGPSNAGIKITGGGQSNFDHNSVVGTADYTAQEENQALFISNSFANYFFCNHWEEMDTLVKVEGPNNLTTFWTNHFFEANTSFCLRSPVSIGTQEHLGNQWQVNNTFGAYISGPDPDGTAENSLFYVDPADEPSCVLLPCSIGSMNTLTVDWFITESAETPDCEDPLNPIAPDEDSLVVLVRRPFNFGSFNSEMEWITKADIFDFLLRNPSYLSNTVLDSFYSAEENSAMGELIASQHGLSIRYGVDKTGKEADITEMNRPSQEMYTLDSVIYTNPINVATYMTLRNLKTDTLSSEFDHWLGLVDYEVNETLSEYGSIDDDVKSLVPGSDLESYLQNGLIYKAQHLLGDGISDSDSSSLFTLMNLCPWEGGRAVAVSYGIYSIYTDSTMSSVTNECSSLEPFQAPETNYQPDEGNHISVFPNPTSDYVTITSTEIIDNVVVRDFSRAIIDNPMPNGNFVTLDLKDLPNGLYQVNLIIDGKPYTKLISVIK